MRIAIVSAAYPFRGGIARFTDTLASELGGREHDIRVFSFKRQYPAFLFPGKSQYSEDGDEGIHDKVRIQLTIDSINPVSWFSTANEIVKFNPDLVVFNYWMPFFAPAFGTIAGRIKKKTSSRVLFICHNVVPHEKRPGDSLLSRYALSKADRFIVLSDSVAIDLKRLIPDAAIIQTDHPVYDIYGSSVAPSEARARLGIEEEKVLLFFGLIRKYKGLDLLLEALPAIIAAIPCRLVIAGEFYHDEGLYRQMIADRKLETHVTIHSGFVPSDEVNTYFCAANLVVLPYTSATQSGIVQIASHFDRSCVVTDTGGLGKMVKDNKTGFVVPPRDSQALAEAVIRFFRENRQAEFETNISESKGKYSWARLAEIIESTV